jgi:transposase-like protein
MTKIKNKTMLPENIMDLINESTGVEDLTSIFESFYDAIMLKERELFLKEHTGLIGHGFYDRSLESALGSLQVDVPRTNSGGFRPAILPKAWKRSDPSYDNLLKALLFNNYSPNKIKAVLNSYNLPYSTEQVEELKEDLLKRAREFKSRQLPEGTFCLFIDAYQTDLRDDDQRIKKAVIYTVLSITLDCRKTVFGSYMYFGNENKDNWLEIFNDLINRGLKKVCMIVSDDFPGLSNTIPSLFPKCDHQLCFVHLKRNIFKSMTKSDAASFMKQLDKLKDNSTDLESAVSGFDNLCQLFSKKYSSFIEHLLFNKTRYFTFIKYPEELRKFIYTTNPSENFNSRLEILRINNGGFFQSGNSLDISIYILYDRLINSKWKNPIPIIKAREYEITQIYNSKYFSS